MQDVSESNSIDARLLLKEPDQENRGAKTKTTNRMLAPIQTTLGFFAVLDQGVPGNKL